MQTPLKQTRSQALVVAKNTSVMIGILMLAFAAVAASLLLFGLYAMARHPEQFGLLQLVLESISGTDALFDANVEGRPVNVTVSHAPLYLVLLLVLGIIISSVAAMVGAFGNLGVALLRLGAEIEQGYPLQRTLGADIRPMSSSANKDDLSVK